MPSCIGPQGGGPFCFCPTSGGSHCHIMCSSWNLCLVCKSACKRIHVFVKAVMSQIRELMNSLIPSCPLIIADVHVSAWREACHKPDGATRFSSDDLRLQVTPHGAVLGHQLPWRLAPLIRGRLYSVIPPSAAQVPMSMSKPIQGARDRRAPVQARGRVSPPRVPPTKHSRDPPLWFGLRHAPRIACPSPPLCGDSVIPLGTPTLPECVWANALQHREKLAQSKRQGGYRDPPRSSIMCLWQERMLLDPRPQWRRAGVRVERCSCA